MKLQLTFFLLFLCLKGLIAVPTFQITLTTPGDYTYDWAFNSLGSVINDVQMISNTIQFPAANVTAFQIVGLSNCYDWDCGVVSKSTYIATRLEVKVTTSTSYAQLLITEYYSGVDMDCYSESPRSLYLPLGNSITTETSDGAFYRISLLNLSQTSFRSSQPLVTGPSFQFTTKDVQPAIYVNGHFSPFQVIPSGFNLPNDVSEIALVLLIGCRDTNCGLVSHSTYTYSVVDVKFYNQNPNYVTVSGTTDHSPLDDSCYTLPINPYNMAVNVPYLLQVPIDEELQTLSMLYRYN